jgi:hypothetical protein
MIVGIREINFTATSLVSSFESVLVHSKHSIIGIEDIRTFIVGAVFGISKR